MPFGLSDPPLRLGTPFQYSPRLKSEPYKRHYHARRRGPVTAESPLRSLRSTTEMLHRLNHKASLSPMDSGIVDDSSNGVGPLGISVAELAGGFNQIALDCTPPAAPAETQEFSSRGSTRTEAETPPSVCPHGFVRARPGTPMSPSDTCPHGFMRAKVDLCPHGIRRARIPDALPPNVCPHGFRRAKVELHGDDVSRYTATPPQNPSTPLLYSISASFILGAPPAFSILQRQSAHLQLDRHVIFSFTATIFPILPPQPIQAFGKHEIF
ncbi:hypothetical protein B0H13DRAFT_2346402 [Mycena leptocephala]|nr:hypothetical protein B0H13DRAFT_2346402 [Mycena leptocephala]